MNKSSFKISKNALVISFMILLATAADGFACSVSVDDNYQKNLLVAHAASFHDISLMKVSSSNMSDYDKSFQGEEVGSGCPQSLVVSARVSFEYSPKKNVSCSSSVSVQIKTYMGEDVPTGPFETVTFSDAEQACSTESSSASPYRIKVPRKIPIASKKPVRIRRI